MLYALVRLYRLGEAVYMEMIGRALSKEQQRAVENLLAVVQAMSADQTSRTLSACSTTPSGLPRTSDQIKTRSDDGSDDSAGSQHEVYDALDPSPILTINAVYSSDSPNLPLSDEIDGFSKDSDHYDQ
jgi:hypothetical protein